MLNRTNINRDEDELKSSSIFLTLNSESVEDVPTYTTVLNSVPKGGTELQLLDWISKGYKREWRWRFLKLPDNRRTVEISYINSNNSNRMYFNKNSQWVERDVSEVYDQFVNQILYYYSN